MNLKFSSTIIAVIFSAAGCGGNNADEAKPDAKSTDAAVQVAAPVEIDITTPDRALKSYWKVQDQVRAAHFAHFKAQLPTLLRAQVPVEKVMTGIAFNDVKAKIGTLDVFIRDIVDVKVESESRAVIIANIKNSTPIPAGAELSKYQEQNRSEGDKYKYVLEKSQPGWQIAEIWDFKTYTSPPGWNKMVPGDGKPFVSSSTYEGR